MWQSRLNGLSFVSDIVSPSIQRHTPWAITLHPQIINSSNQPKISFFSPRRPPRISNSPKLDTVLLAPTRYTNIMIITLFSSLIYKYASSIISELISNCHLTSDRTSMINLVHHCKLSTIFLSNGSELRHSVNFCISLSFTTGRSTFFAFDLSRAAKSIFMS